MKSSYSYIFGSRELIYNKSFVYKDYITPFHFMTVFFKYLILIPSPNHQYFYLIPTDSPHLFSYNIIVKNLK